MKLLVNLASFYWILFFYFIHNEYFLLPIANNDKYFSVLIYLIFGFFLGLISLKFTLNKTYKQTGDNLKVEKIFPIYTEYMPIYLAIIVIAFELNNFVEIENQFTVPIIFLSIYILFHISNIGYLNPIWYLFGYRIFKVENLKANYIFIAYKSKDYKSKMNIDDIRKIDEFTFIKRKD